MITRRIRSCVFAALLMFFSMLCIGLSASSAYAQSKTFDVEPTTPFHLYGTVAAWGVPEAWTTTLDEAWAIVLQRKAELDAQPGCENRWYLDTIYRIEANLRPNPNAEIVNGQTTAWVYDIGYMLCRDGVWNYTTSTISALAQCPPSTSTMSWATSVATTGTTGSYRKWCRATSTAVLPQTCTYVENRATKPVGNPIYPTTGHKVQTEVDYRSSDGALEFVRHYDSARGAFASLLTTRLIDRSTTTPPPGCYPDRVAVTSSQSWGYCFPYANPQPTYSYQVFTSTGQQLAFSGAPGSISGALGVYYWLEQATGAPVVSWGLLHDNLYDFYDAAGRLTGRQWSDGRKMSVVYSDASTPSEIAPGPGFAIKHVDGLGRELNFRYDAVGNLSKLVDPAGRETVYTHEPFENGCAEGNCYRLKSVQYPDGTTRQYYYNEPGLVVGNSPFKMTGITDERGIRIGTYSYDANGRAVSTEGAGGVSRFSVSYPSSTSSAVTDPLGAARTYTYTTHNQTNLVTAQSQPAGAGCIASSQQIAYNTRDSIVETKDFNGNRTCYSYDSTRELETLRIEGINGTSSCSTYLSGSPPAGARMIATQWTSPWRFKKRIAEPLKITSYGYNGQTDPATGATLTCMPGNPAILGQALALLCRKTEQATTDATGGQRFSAAASGAPRVWNYTYDANGRLLTVNGPRTDVADTTTYEYRSSDDGSSPPAYRRGDLWKITNPAGHVTEVLRTDAATGRPLEIMDANQVVTVLTYDSRGRLSSAQVAQELTAFQYDAAGNLTQITSPGGSAVRYSYDDASRLTRVSDAIGNYIEYTLDAAGNRTAEKTYDAAGALKRTVSRTLDVLGRVQQLTGID